MLWVSGDAESLLHTNNGLVNQVAVEGASIVDVEVLDMASTTVGSRALDLSNVPARRYKNPLH